MDGIIYFVALKIGSNVGQARVAEQKLMGVRTDV